MCAAVLLLYYYIKRRGIGGVENLTVHGADSMMEVFDTRVESYNPGSLLVDVYRMLHMMRLIE